MQLLLMFSQEWGDKWTEQFGDGKGAKHGEVWNVGAGGERCAWVYKLPGLHSHALLSVS